MNRQESRERPLHGRVLELAATAIDFELTTAEASELERHLAGCATCARRVAALRADASMLRRPLTLLPSPRVDAAIQAAIGRRRARPQRVMLLAAAALLLAVLLGALAVGAYLLRNVEILPTTVVPTPSPPVTAVSPGPVPSPVAVGATWRPFAIDAEDAGRSLGLMKAVTGTELGFVAVGGPECTPENQPTECRAAVWTTLIGPSWTRAPAQPDLELALDAPNQRPPTGIFDVAAGPAGLVAIGYPYDGRGPGVWHSPDGLIWQRLEVDFGSTPVELSSFRLAAVAAGAGGYVIGGYVIDSAVPNDTATYPARAAAWASPDGLTWTRATDNAAMDIGLCIDTGEDPGCGGMRAIAATATGFVAVGHRRTPADGVVRPAAWTSRDGLAWVESDSGLDFEGTLSAVAAGAPGIVATGSGFDAVSSDGAAWTFVPVTGPPPYDSRLSSDGGVVLGVAWNPLGAALQAWRTTDGLTREPVDVPIQTDVLGISSADVAVRGDRAVIVIWAHLSVPGDGGAPVAPDESLSFYSP